MNRAIFAPTLAVIVSFGLASQAFGHAGTQADPLPSAQTQYGQVPWANGGCPTGFTKLYVRTKTTNDPKTLRTFCFQNDFLPDRQAALYAGEAARAPAPKVVTPSPKAAPAPAPKVATPSPKAAPAPMPKVATPTVPAAPNPPVTQRAPSAVYEQAKLARPGSFINCQGDQNCLTVAREGCHHFNGRAHFQRQLGNGFRNAANQSEAVAMRCEKKG